MRGSKCSTVCAITVSLFRFVSADEITSNLYCAYACVNTLDGLVFSSTDPEGDYYTSLCNDTMRLESIYLSFKAYCTETEIENGLALLQTECQEVAIEIPPFEKIVTPETTMLLTNRSLYIDYDMFQAGSIYNDNNGSVIYNNPVFPNPKLFQLSFKTIAVWYKTYESHSLYGTGMVAYWGLILVIGISVRFLSWVSYLMSLRRIKDPESQSAKSRSLFSKTTALYRRHLGLPATFGLIHQESKGWFTVPTRIQALAVWLFFILNIVACFSSFYTFRQNLYWDATKEQFWRYLSDRAGIVAYHNLPLVFLFAGRNNLFLWLSGWSFATFNVFHRWSARIVVVEGILHSVFYTVLIFAEGGRAEYYSYYKDGNWFYAGVMATVFLSLLIVPSSLYWLRSKFYEIFLRLHIAFSVGIIVCLFYHTAIFEGEFDPYLWSCVAIWSFDRLITMCRILVLNYKSFFNRHRSRVGYHPEQDLLRLKVALSFHWKPLPGSYYFLYFPTMWRGWESHPFTLSSWTASDSMGSIAQFVASDGSSTDSISQNEVSSEKTAANVITVSSPASSSYTSSTEPMELSFLIKPYGGFTADLKKAVVKAGNNKPMTIFVEGPYGMTHHLHRYENLVLIAGGSGITAIIPYVHFLLNDKTGISSPKVRTKKIHIVFTARSAGFVRDIMQGELLNATRRPEVTISLAVTRAEKGMQLDVLSSVASSSPRINLAGERINIADLIRSQVEQAVGDVAVFVCGPTRMGDRARRTVVDITARTKANDVHFFEEHFGW